MGRLLQKIGRTSSAVRLCVEGFLQGSVRAAWPPPHPIHHPPPHSRARTHSHAHMHHLPGLARPPAHMHSRARTHAHAPRTRTQMHPLPLRTLGWTTTEYVLSVKTKQALQRARLQNAGRQCPNVWRGFSKESYNELLHLTSHSHSQVNRCWLGICSRCLSKKAENLTYSKAENLTIFLNTKRHGDRKKAY